MIPARVQKWEQKTPSAAHTFCCSHGGDVSQRQWPDPNNTVMPSRPLPRQYSFSVIIVVFFAQLYRNEHELLRELAQVDAALDDFDRREEVFMTF